MRTRNRRHAALTLLAPALLWQGAVHAQQTTAPATPATPAAPAKRQPAAPVTSTQPDSGIAASVTVSAERPTNRIDRQVYDVKSDASSSNGSAADALNNVPSVNVDPDGSVTLRGSSNVQILVDGKPSAMLQGEARGAALQAIPADDIESVEVINNPGAQFGNEGGGGPILNLVMRRSRKPGGFGFANANVGTAGRYNSSVSGTYNEGRWGFQGGMNVRHDGRDSVSDTVRDRADGTHYTQHSTSKGLNDMGGLNGTVSYNLTDRDTLAASVSYHRRTNDQNGRDQYLTVDDAGLPLEDYVRTTSRSGTSENYGWGARWDHKGTLPGESLKTDLRVSGSTNDATNDFANAYTVGRGRSPLSRQDIDTGNRIVDLTGDYERPTDSGVLKLGYKAVRTSSTSDTMYVDIDPATQGETIDPTRTNSFKYEETVLAAYASYQLRLNERWGILGGMRVEHTDMDISQLTSQVHADNSYLNWIPSAFAQYKVSDDSTLRFSYAHRIRRPNAGDLNPYVIYRDEFNVSSGNPKLKPTKTNSFEVGYETHFGKIEANLRGYLRKEDDAILERKYFISDTVLLTTRDNLGTNRSGGLEFTLTGKLLPTLSLNTSGNLARTEQTQVELDGTQTKRTASSLSGRLRLNWQATPVDMIQTAIQAQGKQLTGQGYREPNTTVNLTYRRSLTSKLALSVNVTDLFDRNKFETITDTALVQEHTVRRFDGRVVYVGLSYRFGGVGSGDRQGEDGPRFRPGGPGGPGPGGFGPGPGGFGG
ncbi:outer membrane beta-barrel family protein [Pseudoduganella flava]|nr:outer membrane beta-barrel family protein [Pseudoduganella flava]QGZ41504.1 TonB-dependent receptor [Pseudoduganella flava]